MVRIEHIRCAQCGNLASPGSGLTFTPLFGGASERVTSHVKSEPMVRIELTTYSLRKSRSTPEPHRQTVPILPNLVA